MSKKAIPYIILLIFAVVVIVIKKINDGRNSGSKAKTTTSQKKSESGGDVNRNRGFDRRISFIKYTDHARCRMQCRKISQEEVEDIMQNGKINYNKSNVKDARCPTFALEGITRDKQQVRIVYGQCDNFTNIITVIDLDTDWHCSCPGDNKKYENKN